MSLSEKASYLKGLMDGMKLNTETDENRLLAKIVELLHDMAVPVADLEDNLDAIDEYLMDDDDDYDEDDYEDYDDDDDYDFDDDSIYEVTCPKCGEVEQLSEEELLKGSIACPKCGEPLEFEFDEDDEE